MLLHLLPQRQGLSGFGARVQRRHGERRRGRRLRAENVFKNPLPALDERGAIRLSGYGEDRAFAEQTAPRVEFTTERDAAELASVDVRDSVVFREPFIDERVIGGQQI